MVKSIVFLFLLAVPLAAAITTVLAVWHLVMMLDKAPRKWVASILGPLILIWPRFLSEAAQPHRVLFLRYLVLSLILIGMFLLIDSLILT